MSAFNFPLELQKWATYLFQSDNNQSAYDRSLVFVSLALMCIGLVMVSSASMPAAERIYENSFHFMIRHSIFVCLGIITALIAMQVPMTWWKQYNAILLVIALFLLIGVLGFGKNVNGSTRWLVLGPINIQAAEPAKLFYFSYLAGYLVRRHEEVRENLKGFIKPLIVFFVFALLLLFQPDLGTVVVMLVTTVGLLFLAGAKLWQFFGLMITGIAAIIILIIAEPYRVQRVTSFWDPWQDPWGSGYQLIQSLLAYSRGDWLGQGLGNSVQKLEYLPEAHTDFVFAILAEELGLVGVVLVLSLLMFLVIKAMFIGNNALQKNKAFEGYFAYAIGIWFSFQTAVNVGASAGILPTKGLTLPLVSYGGSSLLVMCLTTTVLIRIDHEIRMTELQATPKKRKTSIKETTRTSVESKDLMQDVVDDNVSDIPFDTDVNAESSISDFNDFPMEAKS